MSKEIEKQMPVGQPRLVVPLPCPFCGSKAEIDHNEMEQRAGIKASVQCLNLKCRAFGPDGDNKAEAVERWNRRLRCDFCHETPLSPTEREHLDSIRHNDQGMAREALTSPPCSTLPDQP